MDRLHNCQCEIQCRNPSLCWQILRNSYSILCFSVIRNAYSTVNETNRQTKNEDAIVCAHCACLDSNNNNKCVTALCSSTTGYQCYFCETLASNEHMPISNAGSAGQYGIDITWNCRWIIQKQPHLFVFVPLSFVNESVDNKCRSGHWLHTRSRNIYIAIAWCRTRRTSTNYYYLFKYTFECAVRALCVHEI